MTTLQLQVEIDSDAHPELYAMLAGIGKSSLRPERLRQLAAGGIIWEHLRAQPRLDAGASAPMAETARAADHAALHRALARAQAAPAVQEPPVLQDVVEMPVAPAEHAGPREGTPSVTAMPAPVAAAAVASEPGRAAGPRSRLLLMKERGLFKNA